MINSSYANRLVEMLPEEIRLVQQAKSGDTNAFVKLYDAFVEPVFRYVYFQVADDQIAEGITFQIFINAWKQIDNHKVFGLTFASWLYSLARDQVQTYNRTHKKVVASSQDFLVNRGHSFAAEGEGVLTPQALRASLHSLPKDEQQALILKFIVEMPNKSIIRLMNTYDGNIRVLQVRALQALAGDLEKKEVVLHTKKIQRIIEDCQARIFNGTLTVDECLARFPEHATQLAPVLRTLFLLGRARDLKPLPTFSAYTRATLLHYILSHPRTSHKSAETSWRFSYASLAVLVLTLLFTGTAYAQGALPGERLYTWKLTSEKIWRAISPNPVATDIALANRRLDEWIAVSNDPILSLHAQQGYLDALSKLETTDTNTLAMVVPVLQIQQQTLGDAGLSAPQLDDYLTVAILIPLPTPTQIPPSPTVTRTLVPPATSTPTDVPTMPNTPTEVPTASNTPTDIPTATITSTDVPPTATDTPTDVPPTATDVPTDVPPTATDVPTDIPTLEPSPTDVIPLE